MSNAILLKSARERVNQRLEGWEEVASHLMAVNCVPKTFDLSLAKQRSRLISKALFPIRYVLLFLRRRPERTKTLRMAALLEPELVALLPPVLVPPVGDWLDWLADCKTDCFFCPFLGALFESSSFDLMLSKLSTLSDMEIVAVPSNAPLLFRAVLGLLKGPPG